MSSSLCEVTFHRTPFFVHDIKNRNLENSTWSTSDVTLSIIRIVCLSTLENEGVPRDLEKHTKFFRGKQTLSALPCRPLSYLLHSMCEKTDAQGPCVTPRSFRVVKEKCCLLRSLLFCMIPPSLNTEPYGKHKGI